jgi:hypothetical protein
MCCAVQVQQAPPLADGQAAVSGEQQQQQQQQLVWIVSLQVAAAYGLPAFTWYLLVPVSNFLQTSEMWKGEKRRGVSGHSASCHEGCVCACPPPPRPSAGCVCVEGGGECCMQPNYHILGVS